MTRRLLIVMMNSDPANPTDLSGPLLQAKFAAEMEYDVEVLLTGRAGQLALRGFAEKIFLPNEHPKTIYDVLKEAHNAGATFRTCTATIEQWGDQLIEEIAEVVGIAYVISGAMDEETVTLTY